MRKTTLIIALLAVLSGPAFAQSAVEKVPATPKAAATAPKEDVVKYRSERAAAKKDYREKVAALVADYKASKMSKADYSAKRKDLRAENKATVATIAKKYPDLHKAYGGGGVD